MPVNEALKAVYMSLKSNSRPCVVEMDFAGFFNTILHTGLMKALSVLISRRRFKGLIPASIYLGKMLDRWFIENYASYTNIIVRYTDNAVFLFKKEETADAFLKDLRKLVERFGLTLNMKKYHTACLSKSKNNDFDFLGFTIYWGEKKKYRPRLLKFKAKKQSPHTRFQEFVEWITAETPTCTRTRMLREKTLCMQQTKL